LKQSPYITIVIFNIGKRETDRPTSVQYQQDPTSMEIADDVYF